MHTMCTFKNGFKWLEDLSEFNESFTKNYDENSDRGYFSEVDAEYQQIYLILIKIYYF